MSVETIAELRLGVVGTGFGYRTRFARTVTQALFLDLAGL